jgi:predicted DNA-binding ribbon-helix-helix protein
MAPPNSTHSLMPHPTGQRERKASPVIKRSIKISGHSTSISLEDAFWKALKEIAAAKNLSVQGLVSMINSERQYGNLSSAIRLFVLNYYRG